ncbi:Repetitive proline-rich cell wall protein 2 [Diplonema papillatum]|nr:Repetitive proline-rich cell wall protein 2 [Diplonema papillatum]
MCRRGEDGAGEVLLALVALSFVASAGAQLSVYDGMLGCKAAAGEDAARLDGHIAFCSSPQAVLNGISLQQYTCAASEAILHYWCNEDYFISGSCTPGITSACGDLLGDLSLLASHSIECTEPDQALSGFFMRTCGSHDNQYSYTCCTVFSNKGSPSTMTETEVLTPCIADGTLENYANFGEIRCPLEMVIKKMRLQTCGAGMVQYKLTCATPAALTPAPDTDIPTASPPTDAPPTKPPATNPPATPAPQTPAPRTDPPATAAPATKAPATSAPATASPPTDAPRTQAPATSAPATKAPPTSAPPTAAPPTSAPPTSAPPTSAPPTSAPPTSAPPTSAPPTSAPPTRAPPTAAPPTSAPPTSAPPTSAPPTSVPPTSVPPTSAPPTSAPPTSAPPTSAPPTSVPPTSAPPTSAPPTNAPPTSVPETSAPATNAPPTSAPPTSAPLTSAPATSIPETSVPATSAPATSAPATNAPLTSAPLTGAPATAAPRTTAPPTLPPATQAPETGAPPTLAPTAAPETTVPISDVPPTVAPTAAPPTLAAVAPETDAPETRVPSPTQGKNVKTAVDTLKATENNPAVTGAAIISGSPAAGALAVAGAVLDCMIEHSTDGDLEMLIHPLGFRIFDSAHAGAVIGNILLFLGVSALIFVVVGAVKAVRGYSWNEATAACRFPSILGLAPMMLAPGILQCSAELLFYFRRIETTFIALIGFGACTGFGYTMWWLTRPHNFHSELLPMPVGKFQGYFVGSSIWCSRSGLHTEKLGLMFDLYALPKRQVAWYPSLNRGGYMLWEFGHLIPLGMITVLRMETWKTCAMKSLGLALIFFLYLISCLIFRPFLSPFMNHLVYAMTLLPGSGLLFIAYAYWTENGNSHLMEIGAYCFEVAMVLTLVRTLYELVMWGVEFGMSYKTKARARASDENALYNAGEGDAYGEFGGKSLIEMGSPMDNASADFVPLNEANGGDPLANGGLKGGLGAGAVVKSSATLLKKGSEVDASSDVDGDRDHRGKRWPTGASADGSWVGGTEASDGLGSPRGAYANESNVSLLAAAHGAAAGGGGDGLGSPRGGYVNESNVSLLAAAHGAGGGFFSAGGASATSFARGSAAGAAHSNNNNNNNSNNNNGESAREGDSVGGSESSFTADDLGWDDARAGGVPPTATNTAIDLSGADHAGGAAHRALNLDSAVSPTVVNRGGPGGNSSFAMGASPLHSPRSTPSPVNRKIGRIGSSVLPPKRRPSAPGSMSGGETSNARTKPSFVLALPADHPANIYYSTAGIIQDAPSAASHVDDFSDVPGTPPETQRHII